MLKLIYFIFRIAHFIISINLIIYILKKFHQKILIHIKLLPLYFLFKIVYLVSHDFNNNIMLLEVVLLFYLYFFYYYYLIIMLLKLLLLLSCLMRFIVEYNKNVHVYVRRYFYTLLDYWDILKTFWLYNWFLQVTTPNALKYFF